MAEGGNMSNLAKHLSDRHHDLYTEYKKRQVRKKTWLDYDK